MALARAIVFHPEIVLMDEPLGALDKNLRYQMQTEIKALQRKLNMTVVFVTHDQEEAMNMSDRIAIMNNGQIEQLGTPKEVYESPCNVFSAAFLGEANILAYEHLDAQYRRHMNLREQDCLFIRPERVKLSATEHDNGDKSALTGEIIHLSFLGNIIRYHVRINGSLKVYSDSTNLSGMQAFEVGQRVRLNWERAEDIRILRHA